MLHSTHFSMFGTLRNVFRAPQFVRLAAPMHTAAMPLTSNTVTSLVAAIRPKINMNRFPMTMTLPLVLQRFVAEAESLALWIVQSSTMKKRRSKMRKHKRKKRRKMLKKNTKISRLG